MNVSKRLQKVASFVMAGGVVADIGCDHGFTSIFLVENGLAKSAIAMDINQGPLERAREHIGQYRMQKRIQVRLSDGLEELKPGEADTILISGMGGALISRILKDNEDVTKAAKELVLSPQSEIYLVRQTLHYMGFCIHKEEMVFDQGKYYVVMRAIPGKEVYSEEEDYLYGKVLIEQKEEVFLSFLHKENERVNRIIENLSKKELSHDAKWKLNKLKKEKACIEKVYKRMKS